MLEALKWPDSGDRFSARFWLCLIFLFAVVLALHAKPVPLNNELLYLLRLEPNFLPNDWSFSQPANEHWFFNFLSSFPARFLSLESLGWAGRISGWLLCLTAIIRLGRQWEIPNWAIAISVSAWLGLGQAIVNAEWIFGTFEAKVPAYVCLLFSIVGFSDRRIVWPSILLGLSFSFHPAVGLWAIAAVGAVLVFERVPNRDLLKTVGLIFLFSLPGILPFFLEPSAASPASTADWEFIVTKHMPYHFDPFYFSKIGMAVLAIMFIINVAALRRVTSFSLRFLRGFQIAIALFFVLGVALRVLELYPLLRFMPMRLFPILTPLFFFFTVFYLITRLGSLGKKIALAAFAVAILLPLDPVYQGIGRLRETKDAWMAKPDDEETALRWVAENTPRDAVLMAPPISRDVWYLSRRAQVVSYSYPRYDRLPEWRQRVADVTANVPITDRDTAPDTLTGAFEGLSATEIEVISSKYSASHLLSRSAYPFPVIFETQTYKIYRLPQK